MPAEDVESIDAAEHASEGVSKEEGRGSLKLWFGVLGSPLAWAGHLGANYSLEEWFACSRAAEHHEGEILGFGVHNVALLINTLMLAIAVLSGLAAYACWRKLRGGGGDDDEDADDDDQAPEGIDDSTERARWMSFAGVVEGALFVGIILLGYLPALTLGACETSP